MAQLATRNGRSAARTASGHAGEGRGRCRRKPGARLAGRHAVSLVGRSDPCAGVTAICCGIVLECCAGCVCAGRRRDRRSASVGISSTCGSWVWGSVGAVSRPARFPACTVNDAGMWRATRARGNPARSRRPSREHRSLRRRGCRGEEASRPTSQVTQVHTTLLGRGRQSGSKVHCLIEHGCSNGGLLAHVAEDRDLRPGCNQGIGDPIDPNARAPAISALVPCDPLQSEDAVGARELAKAQCHHAGVRRHKPSWHSPPTSGTHLSP